MSEEFLLEVIIATRNRLEKLQKTLLSIPQQGWDNIKVKVIICADGDVPTYTWTNNHSYESYMTKHQKGSVYCRNLLSSKTSGSVLYSTDDIIFQPNAIQIAFKSLLEHFPNTDGIIGFNQTGNTRFSKSGVALIGQTFMLRFPNRQIFCPQYFHFAAQEVLELGQHYNRFIFEPAAIVHHLNPMRHHKYMDHTHVDARKRKAQDHKVRKERQSKGLIWGLAS